MKKMMVYFLKIVNFGTCQRFYKSERHFWGLQLIDSFKFVLIRFDRYSKKKTAQIYIPSKIKKNYENIILCHDHYDVMIPNCCTTSPQYFTQLLN